MKEIYNDTNTLCGGFYSDIMEEINTQIKFLEGCIKNLKKQL